MSGGITQLVAIGAQDVHLVGNPEVSFFRSSYKRHTNFSSTVDSQVIQGQPAPGGMSSVRFERKGDLLSYVYLTKKLGGNINPIGPGDINRVELLIGGQIIDTQDSVFSSNIAPILLSASGNRTSFSQYNTINSSVPTWFPLTFWFCEHVQASIPLVSLQYHDVEIRIYWETGVNTSAQYECWAKFYYLDTQEREQMVSSPQNILMYQVQKSLKSGTKVQELNFNHPVQCLASLSNIFDTTANLLTSTVKLQINGVDVSNFKPLDPHFVRVPYYYHSHSEYATYAGPSIISYPNDFMFFYPFCLESNKLQPTGTLNFSRIDTARLLTESPNGFNQTSIYAVNYNILKVQNGMGGLMYAN
jgi:hypothetical protein